MGARLTDSETMYHFIIECLRQQLEAGSLSADGFRMLEAEARRRYRPDRTSIVSPDA